jgi:hypothetical protein
LRRGACRAPRSSKWAWADAPEILSGIHDIGASTYVDDIFWFVVAYLADGETIKLAHDAETYADQLSADNAPLGAWPENGSFAQNRENRK